jgi:hypothetical protein
MEAYFARQAQTPAAPRLKVSDDRLVCQRAGNPLRVKVAVDAGLTL